MTHPVKPLPQISSALSPDILGNCYKWVKLNYPTLPPTKEIWANLQQEPAEVVVMMYHVPHYAVVEQVGDDFIAISETNFGGDRLNKRLLSKEDYHIVGYYSIIK